MKLTLIECDWKRSFIAKDLNTVRERISPKAKYTPFKQHYIDSNLMFISSKELSYKDMEKLFQVGDLYICDKIWKGSLKEIKRQLKKYVKKMQ